MFLTGHGRSVSNLLLKQCQHAGERLVAVRPSRYHTRHKPQRTDITDDDISERNNDSPWDKFRSVKKDLAKYFQKVSQRKWKLRSSFSRENKSSVLAEPSLGVDSITSEIRSQIIPKLSTETVTSLVECLYGLRVKTVEELDSYADKNFYVTVAEEEWENTNIPQLWPEGYVLKLLNSEESSSNHYEAEHDMQKIMRRKGFRCPQPVFNINGYESSLETLPGSSEYNARHRCRLMTYIPGEVLHNVPYTSSLMYNVGEYLARVQEALQGYHHPALSSYDTIWSLSNVPKLQPLVETVNGHRRRNLVRRVFEAFQQEVVPKYNSFQKGAIHGDFNDFNIIVQDYKDEDGQLQHKVHGVIDFGDSTESYYVFDVAIAIMYLSLESRIIDPLLAGRYVLQGYLSKADLNTEEKAALRTCVAARYAQSLVMAEYSSSKQPDNKYLSNTIKRGWTQLAKLWDTPESIIRTQWKCTP